jgi:hypothetical protein
MKLWIFGLFALLALSFVSAQDIPEVPSVAAELMECMTCSSSVIGQEKECKCSKGSQVITPITKLKGTLGKAYCCREDSTPPPKQ